MYKIYIENLFSFQLIFKLLNLLIYIRYIVYLIIAIEVFFLQILVKLSSFDLRLYNLLNKKCIYFCLSLCKQFFFYLGTYYNDLYIYINICICLQYTLIQKSLFYMY